MIQPTGTWVRVEPEERKGAVTTPTTTKSYDIILGEELKKIDVEVTLAHDASVPTTQLTMEITPQSVGITAEYLATATVEIKGTTAMITNFEVNAEHRGNGWGTQLGNAVLLELKKLDCTTVSLDAHPYENSMGTSKQEKMINLRKLIQFYTRLGFTVISRNDKEGTARMTRKF